MAKTTWTPWHQAVKLREDLRTGELALNEFAADLYEVALQSGKRRLYEDPSEFFALTYPTFALRELAKDVVWRLAGKNQKAVRQLELTYGGGKTHTLITLYHLVNRPDALPDLPSVQEFRAHIGIDLPAARVAILPFDKFDAEKGIEVRDPSENRRMVRQPWSALAWQLGGAAGLRVLHADDKDEERKTAPAENLLSTLLAMPQAEGRSTLLLIDEVLMFAHSAVDADPAWRERLKNFFQALTQAATKVDRCAIVASLLATDIRKNDQLGQEISQDLYDIFRREREEGVEPVGKKDVAEVLRRRFFTPDSIGDKSAYRQRVIDAIKGIVSLDDDTKKNQKQEEERFLDSYPFHPDLTEVLYSKWTQLQGFQRTRGVLRTFALALRAAERWDTAPLVGPNVFLSQPGEATLSEGARELTQVASVEDSGGKRQQWSAILDGELQKAREAQADYPSLKHREVEQAAFATFLHSQPAGAKAQLRELLVLVGATQPDKIDLLKALRGWFDRSWFLDEAADAGLQESGGVKPAPSSWRLGTKPNLKQMHFEARTRIIDESVEDQLIEEVRGTQSLVATASQAGAKVHKLPERPVQIDDDGVFRYAVLGPSAASQSGNPSPEARRFLDETTGKDRPRVERNSVVLAVPSKDGLAAARDAVRDHLAWLAVRETLEKEGHELDLIRQQNLDAYTAAARRRMGDSIRQAWCIVVTVSERNDVQAFKLQVGDEPLFSTIKKDARSRIQETAVSPDAMLPGGPYALWRDNEESRPVRDLVGAFARFPHLPKMLNRQAIADTVVKGCSEGTFVARLQRPDGSFRTWWREALPTDVPDEPLLEVVLPEKAQLTSLAPRLVEPMVLDSLWSTPKLTVGEARGFFDGQHTVTVSRGGYDEPVPVPAVPAGVVDDALRASVAEGRLWLTSGPASLLAEDVPAGLLTPDAAIQAPPAPLSLLEFLPDQVPEAWQGERTDAMSLAVAVSKRAAQPLPWTTIRNGLDDALRSRLLERDTNSGPWPCDFSQARAVAIRIPSAGSGPEPPKPGPEIPQDVRVSGDAVLGPNQIQDLAEAVQDLLKAAAGYDVSFQVKLQVRGRNKQRPDDKTVAAINRAVGDIEAELKIK